MRPEKSQEIVGLLFKTKFWMGVLGFSKTNRYGDQSVLTVLPGRGVLPSNGLLGRCRWMGSHIYGLTDCNGVTLSRDFESICPKVIKMGLE